MQEQGLIDRVKFWSLLLHHPSAFEIGKDLQLLQEYISREGKEEVVTKHVMDFKCIARSNVLQKPTADSTGSVDYNASTGVVITRKTRTTGFDMHHLGAFVTGVYAGNAANRHQARGRIKRIGQERKRLLYQTVYAPGTILELLLQKHRSTDKKNASLDTVVADYLQRFDTPDPSQSSSGAGTKRPASPQDSGDQPDAKKKP